MQSPQLQYNNNNSLILNKNNFLAIDTSAGNNNNSNILIHNKGSCNMMLTATPASAPSPSMNYISKETINYA